MPGAAGSFVPNGRHVMWFCSRLYRDLCFTSSGVIFCPDCIGIHSFMSISVCASMWITVCRCNLRTSIFVTLMLT
jgi:hypothetical protein